MSLATIFSDSREQKPWTFEDYPVETETVTLRTGDYTLPMLCDYDEDNDSYIPQLAVERKSGNDFLGSLTHERERFKREVKRAESWPEQMRIIVEEPRHKIEENVGFMSHRGVTPSQILGTIDAWNRYYNVEFIFCPTRRAAEQKAFDHLFTWKRIYEDGGLSANAE